MCAIEIFEYVLSLPLHAVSEVTDIVCPVMTRILCTACILSSRDEQAFVKSQNTHAHTYISLLQDEYARNKYTAKTTVFAHYYIVFVAAV